MTATDDSTYESWIVVKGTRNGKPHAERHVLNIPVDLATGKYGELSDLQVRDFIADLQAEQYRRDTAAMKPSAT